MKKRPTTPEEIEKKLKLLTHAGCQMDLVQKDRESCLKEGLEDEACDLCGDILLSNQHHVNCRNRPGCPYSTGKTLIEHWIEQDVNTKP